MPRLTFESPSLFGLVVFVCVHKFGSYSKAGDYLGCTQGAVSRQLATLEKWFGRAIFTNNRPPRLTPFGEKILPVAMQTLRTFYAFRGTVAQYDGEGKAITAPADDQKVMALISTWQI